MSSNKSYGDISSGEVQRLTASLVENRNQVLSDADLLHRLSALKNTIAELEDDYLSRLSHTASETLSGMDETERRMLLMWPEEKIFFLRYKKQHPENPWGYYSEYQQGLQERYKQSGELPYL